MNFDALKKAPRLLLEANVKPVAGDRFQPTGFADLGAAEYNSPLGIKMLLVESAQSVANRLEKTCLDGDGPDIDPALVGIPYVEGELTGGPQGTIRTSSLVEAHRIASPYFLLNNEFRERLRKEMSYEPKGHLNWKTIYATLFKYDPNSLIHGVFLSLLEGGRIRTPRALTGFIEASNVERVVSGGVKNSPVDPKGEIQVAEAKASEKGVYSNVPYSRVEYVASQITAYFNLDLSLIRGYGLGEAAEKFLISLALLKVRRFLNSQLRLRTACDFQVMEIQAKSPEGFELAEEDTLLKEVQTGIASNKNLFSQPPVTTVVTKVKVVASGG